MTDEAVSELLEAADRLAVYVLKQRLNGDVHREAIIITYLAFRFLQSAWYSPDKCITVIPGTGCCKGEAVVLAELDEMIQEADEMLAELARRADSG